MKSCIKCGESKPLSEFHKDKERHDGHVSSCRVCKKAYRASYYSENAESLKEYSRVYAKENAIAHLERGRNWRSANRARHLGKRKEYFASEYENNPEFSCNYKMRSMLRRTLLAIGTEKECSTSDSLGYSAKQLMERLSVNFKPGMSWDNFGDWEIDHIIPLSVMIARGETRPHILNALCNLAPKWQHENRSKGNRYVG